MSTLKVDELVSLRNPMPIIKDTAIAIQTFTPTAGQAVYNLTNVDIIRGGPIKVFRNSEEIAARWTGDDEVTVTNPGEILNTDLVHICSVKYHPFIEQLLSCESKEDVQALLD